MRVDTLWHSRAHIHLVLIGSEAPIRVRIRAQRALGLESVHLGRAEGTTPLVPSCIGKRGDLLVGRLSGGDDRAYFLGLRCRSHKAHLREALGHRWLIYCCIRLPGFRRDGSSCRKALACCYRIFEQGLPWRRFTRNTNHSFHRFVPWNCPFRAPHKQYGLLNE